MADLSADAPDAHNVPDVPAPARLDLPTLVDAGPLALRVYEDHDAPALVAAVSANLEHLRPWMPWIAHEPMSIADRTILIRSWADELRRGTGAVYGIFVDDVLVGGTGYHGRIGPGGLEIGYWIDRDHLGRGFATTTARALTDRAFTIDGVDRIEIHHDVANVASEGVPVRLGFRHVRDEAREPAAPAETGWLRIWQVTREEWPARA